VKSFITPLIAIAESEPVGPSNVGLGSVVLTLSIGAFLVWVGYVVINSRRRTRPAETAPPNQEFFLDNERLENDRLTRVLTAAVIAAAVLAIVIPLYYVNETNRQEAAAEEIRDEDLHFGQEWWFKFECSSCHGPEGGGGGREIVEGRSGLTVTWAAPSINDIFYRFDEQEVRHTIVNGRAGSRMPANGLAGGGAMTVQEIDQVVAHLRSLQVPQMEAFSKVDGLVEAALKRIAGGEAAVKARLLVENAKLDDILEGPQKYSVLSDMPDDIDTLLGSIGTCTVESAALVGRTCSGEGVDTDRDGLTDEAETALGALATEAFEAITTRAVDSVTGEVSKVPDSGFDLSVSPTSAYSMFDAAGNPMADLEAAAAFLSHLDAKHLELSLLADRTDEFSERVIEGIAFLEAALDQRTWDIDFDQVAADMGLSLADAERAVGLFNAYCARCHTASYSAGVAFEQEIGSGAWAPALTDGRAVAQFPNEQDHIDFVINGAEASEEYGVSGLSGVGGMPAFGALLSEEDIALIVNFERSLQ
jgi:mono/diheme cytochrome c family protein